LWVWHGSGLAIDEGESLVEVWAVLEASDVGSDVLLLGELVVRGAVVADLWVWHSSGLAVGERESLIEVWAVWKRSVGWSPVWLILLLSELVLLGAVVSDLWVWDCSGSAIGESESLIEIWAVRERAMWCSPVWILLLSELVFTGAVVSNLWVWHGSGLAIGEGESLIEVWAMWKTGMSWSPVWLILNELVLLGAVVSNIWVWHGSSLSVVEGESLVEVWAVRKGSVGWSPVWILLLGELVVTGAVISDLWVWHSSSLSVVEGESLVEVWAVWKGSVGWSPVWIILLLSELVVTGAVVSNLWVWHSSGLAIGERESLVEVWAMWKGSVGWSPVWIILLLSELIVTSAVISDLWVWHGSGLSVIEGESLIEIWAMWKASVWCSPVWIVTKLNMVLLLKLIVWVAVEANLWVWDTLSFSILKSKSFIEVGAVLQGLDGSSHGASSWVLLNECGVINELDEGGILLHSAGRANIWVLGNVSLAVVHDGSSWVGWALWE